MLRNFIFVGIVATGTFLSSCQQLLDALPKNYGSLVRDLLAVGSDSAVKRLGVAGGYNNFADVRILLPPEIREAESALRTVGLGAEVDRFANQLNTSAEQAVVKAVPIFLNEVYKLTITDAINIYNGGDTAATAFLRRTSTNALTSTFRPKIDSVLNLPLVAGISANTTWSTISSSYSLARTINPSLPPLTTNLADYTTGRAISGLFLRMRQLERDFRTKFSESVRTDRASVLRNRFNIIAR